jgi:nanoRNase/pAp phosphatase (c-di-AMP/oligoRNAs hydrolase)
VVHGDPTDPSTYPDDVDAVVVCGDADATEAARRARTAFPDALVVACSDAAGIGDVADRVVSPRSVVCGRLRESASGPRSDRARRLLRALRDIDGGLAVVMHGNPDPDAIASAVALTRVARRAGVDADACYYGDISHQENRALVNLLDLDLRNLDAASDIEAYGGVALVDHSRPGVNDGLDPDTDVDVVIDHHPPRGPIDAGYVDIRGDVGATSTLLVEYLDHLGIDPGREVATALLYGIRIDTREFTREAVDADFTAAAFLLEFADQSVLDQVESPSMSAEVLETLAAAIRNRTVRDDVLITGVGEIRDRDALAQASDKLLNMEGISVAIVYGFVDETVYVSGRARGTDVDLGETLRDALDPIGSAGGHVDMAGAQIPLGILGEADDSTNETLTTIVDDVIAGRIFEVLRDPPSTPRRGVEDDGFDAR